MKKLLALLLTLAMVLTLAACNGATSQNNENQQETENPQENQTQPADEDEQEEDAIDSETQALIQEAIERSAKRTGAQSAWEGPTTGPEAVPDKTVAVIMDTAENSISKLWNDTSVAAIEAIGWEAISMNGKGTVDGELECMNQAIALGVDGIIIMMDAEAMVEPLTKCEELGIFVIGMHASSTQGVDAEHHLSFNITTSGYDIGDAMADYVIADSNGTGRVIILYDAQYAIARQKVEAMQDRLETISSIEVLEVVNSPLSDAATNVPTLVNSWVASYGTPLYILTIADVYYDYAAAALAAGGVDPADVKLIGADGTEAAYARIRTGDYQVVTVPEPGSMFGYMAVDALNRLFAGEEPDPYMPSIFLVTPENVDAEGGDQNMFVPSNNFAEEYAKIWGVN